MDCQPGKDPDSKCSLCWTHTLWHSGKLGKFQAKPSYGEDGLYERRELETPLLYCKPTKSVFTQLWQHTPMISALGGGGAEAGGLPSFQASLSYILTTKSARRCLKSSAIPQKKRRVCTVKIFSDDWGVSANQATDLYCKDFWKLLRGEEKDGLRERERERRGDGGKCGWRLWMQSLR